MAMWHVWLIVALVFLILEIFTTGIAVICFSFGAVGSCVAALFGANLTWQVIIFAIVTLLSFIFIRPMLIKLFYKKGKNEVKTNYEALSGRIGIVSEAINPATGEGRVKVDGDDWKAVSVDDQPIELGARVKILKLDSVIVTVKRAD
ncbi:MAG: NfeD family protein [Bacteroidales bacterium]|nr:NfeD family protein [Bacteroidales bacterium]